MYLQLLGRVSFQNTAERTYTGHGRAVTIMGNWVEQRQQQDLDTCTPAPVPANPEALQLLEVGITAAACCTTGNWMVVPLAYRGAVRHGQGARQAAA